MEMQESSNRKREMGWEMGWIMLDSVCVTVMEVMENSFVLDVCMCVEAHVLH